MMIAELEQRFNQLADPLQAKAMSAYMKFHFSFYGISAPSRKELSKDLIIRNGIRDKQELWTLVNAMWARSEREWQYTAIQLLEMNVKILNAEDFDGITKLLITKSWWDTVDGLSSNVVGMLLQKYPEHKRKVLDPWMSSGNMWLQRTCLIHQLKYKSKTDTDYLREAILQLNSSGEFFIQKAIGWALRQYAKTDPEWVTRFTDVNELKPLSRREALKNFG